jgi:hypothetical protein
MKSNWSNSPGLALIGAAVLLLAILHRLDLLLIITPLSILFGYGLVRARSESYRVRIGQR